MFLPLNNHSLSRICLGPFFFHLVIHVSIAITLSFLYNLKVSNSPNGYFIEKVTIYAIVYNTTCIKFSLKHLYLTIQTWSYEISFCYHWYAKRKWRHKHWRTYQQSTPIEHSSHWQRSTLNVEGVSSLSWLWSLVFGRSRSHLKVRLRLRMKGRNWLTGKWGEIWPEIRGIFVTG